MKVTVIGASGFIGGHLSAALRARGDDVTTASLRDAAAAAQACAGADAVVNLAGETVAQRWTPEAKAKIRASRVDVTRALLENMKTLDVRPKTYVSASAIGYYGTSLEKSFDETSPPGDDFLAGLCVAWETEADQAGALGMRVAKIRTGLVLGTDGGALAKLLPLFKSGAGGVVASGKQWYSWIHIDDQIGVYLHAIDEAGGALDATAPYPVRNAEFTRAFAAALRRPAILPVPAFALKMLLGDGASIATEGQNVLPNRTIATGYRFKYETIDAAFAALVGS